MKCTDVNFKFFVAQLLLHRASEEERHDWKKDVAEDELFLEEENTT